MGSDPFRGRTRDMGLSWRGGLDELQLTGSSLLSRVRKDRKARLAEMASRVLWGSPVRPAPWAPPEKMATR